MTSSDARRHTRFGLEVDVTIRSKTSGLIPGTTIEVSESGMSTLLPVDLPVGEIVELHINLPLGSVDLRAVVRNRNAFRYGFEFADHSLARDVLGGYLHSDRTLVFRKAHVANYWIVDSKNRIVIAKFGGRLTIAEAEQYAADLRNNISFDPSFSELADMTEVEDPQINYASATRFARESDPFSHESKRAVVAPQRAMYETAHMYKLIRKDENIVLFKTVDEAKGWLGLPANP